MDIKPTSYKYDGEGIECAYRNENGLFVLKIGNRIMTLMG